MPVRAVGSPGMWAGGDRAVAQCHHSLTGCWDQLNRKQAAGSENWTDGNPLLATKARHWLGLPDTNSNTPLKSHVEEKGGPDQPGTQSR